MPQTKAGRSTAPRQREENEILKAKAGPSTAPPPKEPSEQPDTDVDSGVATDLWIELKAYPDEAGRLWLLVDEKWRYLENPSDLVLTSVQSVFCNCPDKCEVVVWYDDVNAIAGLVVRSNFTFTQ